MLVFVDCCGREVEELVAGVWCGPMKEPSTNTVWQNARAYGLALALVAGATVLRLALDPILQNNLPFVSYFIAVAVVAWWLGLGPAIVATLAGSYLAERLFFPPRHGLFPYHLTPLSISGTLAYFMVCGIILLLTESMRRAHNERRLLNLKLNRELLETRKAQSALAESESRKAAIVENALDAIITMDHEGRIVDFNPAAERIFGRTRKEALGQALAEVIIPPRLREGHWAGLRRYLETGEGPILERRIEMPALRASGEEFPVELAVTAVRVPDGPPLFTGYLRDISQRKHDEQELKEALEDARRSSLLKDEFLATLSHELRTPMNAILGWAQMLRETTIGTEPEAFDEGLQVIERNARLQAQIIEDLLDMSRILAGKIGLSIQSVKLGEIVSAAMDAIRPAANAKGVRLENICDTNVSDVRGDPARLQQVVYNLLTNAVKFTPRDGRVQVLCRRVNSHVEISVSDTGVGISPQFLPFVFERFRQQDSSARRQYSGLGLGLSIVKQIVEAHGGTVQAASEGSGRGAIFTINLPVAIAIQPPLPAGALQDEYFVSGDGAGLDGIDTSRVRGRTVLLVEDESDARHLLRRVLEARGLKCLEAATGQEALQILGDGDAAGPDHLGPWDARDGRLRPDRQGAPVAAGARWRYTRDRPHRLRSSRRPDPLAHGRISAASFQARGNGRVPRRRYSSARLTCPGWPPPGGRRGRRSASESPSASATTRRFFRS